MDRVKNGQYLSMGERLVLYRVITPHKGPLTMYWPLDLQYLVVSCNVLGFQKTFLGPQFKANKSKEVEKTSVID